MAIPVPPIGQQLSGAKLDPSRDLVLQLGLLTTEAVLALYQIPRTSMVMMMASPENRLPAAEAEASETGFLDLSGVQGAKVMRMKVVYMLPCSRERIDTPREDGMRQSNLYIDGSIPECHRTR